MAPPLASSTLAFWVKLDTLMMPMTSRMAASALATEIRPINTLVRLWSQGRSRSMRPGSPMMRTASNPTTRTRKSQAASPLRSWCGSAARRRPVAIDGDRHGPARLAEAGLALLLRLLRAGHRAIVAHAAADRPVTPRRQRTVALGDVRPLKREHGVERHGGTAQHVGHGGDPCRPQQGRGRPITSGKALSA